MLVSDVVVPIFRQEVKLEMRENAMSGAGDLLSGNISDTEDTQDPSPPNRKIVDDLYGKTWLWLLFVQRSV
jgi:hypothetical protein